MKTLKTTEFNNDIDSYLNEAENEGIIIQNNKGLSYILIPIEEEKEGFYLNDAQKKSINEALKSIEEGKIYTHKEAMNFLKTRHPNYF